MKTLHDVEARLGKKFFEHQREFLEQLPENQEKYRACLYYKTGAGKSLTALAAMRLGGYTDVLVVAPPSTHRAWERQAWELGMTVQAVSHARFRRASYKVSRSVPIVMDEFHLLGGQKGVGWRKLSRVSGGLTAPLLLLSATPNYNDAERCYCVQYILDPTSVRGGYLEFLYRNCVTEQNPFSQTPKVTGFKEHADAAAYLSSLPHVFHLPDERVVDIEEIPYDENIADEIFEYMYDRRRHRIIASRIELDHVVRYQGLVDADDMYIRPSVWRLMKPHLNKPVLIYCNHATVAEAVSRTLARGRVDHALVTGKTSKRDKDMYLDLFRDGEVTVLVGTATLATGTDGLDRVCDTLLILDDTNDDALRRQLVGRILPRGDFESVQTKRVLRWMPI